ncbi:MAG: hypothetical protein WD993_00325 [Thermoleophilaceae bacterium]
MSEPRMLGLCGLARSTFQSWVRAGLDINDPGGAYGEGAVLRTALLVQVREHLSLDDMVGAWRDFTASGAATEFLNHARCLREDGRLDLVIEPEHAGMAIARNDEELIAAVRHGNAPRPVIVVDVADRILHVLQSFRRMAKPGARPTERRRGRPRRSQGLRAIDSRRDS